MKALTCALISTLIAIPLVLSACGGGGEAMSFQWKRDRRARDPGPDVYT